MAELSLDGAVLVSCTSAFESPAVDRVDRSPRGSPQARRSRSAVELRRRRRESSASPTAAASALALRRRPAGLARRCSRSHSGSTAGSAYSLSSGPTAQWQVACRPQPSRLCGPEQPPFTSTAFDLASSEPGEPARQSKSHFGPARDRMVRRRGVLGPCSPLDPRWLPSRRLDGLPRSVGHEGHVSITAAQRRRREHMLRIMMSAYPAFVLLLGSLVFCVPRLAARRCSRPPCRPLPTARRTAAQTGPSKHTSPLAGFGAASAIFALLPLCARGRGALARTRGRDLCCPFGCCAACDPALRCSSSVSAVRVISRWKTRNPREATSSIASCEPRHRRRCDLHAGSPTARTTRARHAGPRRAPERARFLRRGPARDLDLPSRPRRELLEALYGTSYSLVPPVVVIVP